MNVIIVSTALNPRNDPLEKAFKGRGFTVQNKWLGNKEWPEFSEDLEGIIFLDDGKLQIFESLIEARQKTRNYNNLPLLVVPEDFGPKVKVKYISAGATQVCSPDDTDERIVAEVLTKAEFNSRDTSQARLEILHPFIAATIEAVEIMTSMTVNVDKVFRKKNYEMNGDISGLISLVGKTERMLAVTFPKSTAKTMSSKVLAGTVDDPNMEMISDCVGEMVNIVAGQVKGRFVHTDYEFDISIPTTITGPAHEIRHKAELPCYVMTFAGEMGDFSLQLCVRGTD